MGTTSSRTQDTEARDPVLSEHLATSEEDEGDEGRRPRGGRESDSESEVDEERGEEDNEEQRREENMSYYDEMLRGSDRFVDILGGMPRGDRLISRPPRVHQTRSVVCDVNLAKETLRLLPIVPEDAPPATTEPPKAATLYQVRFNFDANVECRIRLFFAAQETRDENNHLTGYLSRIKTEVPPLQFPAGLGQEYVQSIANPLDVSLFEKYDLEYAPQNRVIPVIIVIEPLVTDGQQRVTSQTTFATLLKCSDDTFAIKAVKVKIEWCGATYIVHDIYGLDQSSDAGRECVICMTDARDTIVLPCRHMCLCRGCAEVLRYQTNKCPICRSLFTALLKIEVSKEGGEESDEESLLKSKKKKRTEKGEKEEEGLTSKKKKKKDSTVVVTQQGGAASSKEPSEDFNGRDVIISVAN